MIFHLAACAIDTLPSPTEDPLPYSSPAQNPRFDLLRFTGTASVAIGHIRTATFGAHSLLSAEDTSPAVVMFYSLTRLGGASSIIFSVRGGERALTISAFANFALVCDVSLLVARCSFWAFEFRTEAVRRWIKRRLARRLQPSLTADRLT